MEIGLTGLPVLENDEMVASRHDTELASWLALAAVIVLYLIVFRGLYYPALTVGTLLIGIAWSLGWLTLTVGHLNILSATFAVMLIAMGDYGVLWVTRYEQARRSGMDVPSALIHTATHVAVGNLTAATALALAFFAAMLSDFKAVAVLGWVAGCGVLLCALGCFSVLPAVLMLADRRGKLQIADCRLKIVRQNGTTVAISNLQSAICNLQSQPGWLPRLSARPWLVIGTALILVVGLGAFAFRVHYDHNLLHLQARDLDAVKWETTLIEHTDGASWHALSYTNTPEEALALKARYEKLPEVSRVVEVASLVPREQDRKVGLLREISLPLQGLPERGHPVPHVPPEFNNPRNPVAGQMELVRLSLANLMKNVKKANGPGSPPLLAELGAAAEALDRRLAGMDPEDGLRRLSDFELRLKGDLAEDLHRLRDVATPAPITLDDLPPALRERYVGHSGKWLLRIFARDCLWDYGPLEHFTHQVQTVDPDATGKPFGTVEGLKSLRNGFQWAGLYALGVIVLVLLADFRNVRHALIALAPLAMGMLLSLGVLGLCGLPLNPANMIALPLILGVGIDNGVHVLHDYLMRCREGQSTISRAIGRGVLVKAADDDDRLRHAHGVQPSRPVRPRLHPDAGRGLLHGNGSWCSCPPCCALLPRADARPSTTMSSKKSGRWRHGFRGHLANPSNQRRHSRCSQAGVLWRRSAVSKPPSRSWSVTSSLGFWPGLYFRQEPRLGSSLPRWFMSWSVSPASSCGTGFMAVSLFFVLSGFVLSLSGFFLATGRFRPLGSAAVHAARHSCFRWRRRSLLAFTPDETQEVVCNQDAVRFMGNDAQGLPHGTDPNAGPGESNGWLTHYYDFTPDLSSAVNEGTWGAFTGTVRYNLPLWTMQLELIGSFLVFGFLALFGQETARLTLAPLYGLADASSTLTEPLHYLLDFVLGMAAACDLWVHIISGPGGDPLPAALATGC